MSIFLLHLETSTKICSVALSKDGAVVDFIDRMGDGFIHGESLTLMIEEVLEKCQIPLSALIVSSYLFHKSFFLHSIIFPMFARITAHVARAGLSRFSHLPNVLFTTRFVSMPKFWL